MAGVKKASPVAIKDARGVGEAGLWGFLQAITNLELYPESSSDKFYKDHLGCSRRNDLERGRSGDMEQTERLFWWFK